MQHMSFPSNYNQKTVKLIFTSLALCCFCLAQISPEIVAQVVDGEKSQDSKPNENILEQSLHKAEMRITGSMCISCLNRLNQNLKSQYGIIKVKVDLSQAGFSDPASPSVLRWAQATVIYDASQISLAAIRNYLEELGYASYKVKDKAIDNINQK